MTVNDAVVWGFQGAVVPGAAHLWATLGPSQALFESLFQTRGTFGVSHLGERYPAEELIALKHRLFVWPFRWTSYFTTACEMRIQDFFHPRGHNVLMGHRAHCWTKREAIHLLIERIRRNNGQIVLHLFDAFDETITDYRPNEAARSMLKDGVARQFYNPWRRSIGFGALLGLGVGLVRILFGEEPDWSERLKTVAASTLSGTVGTVAFTLLRRGELLRGRQSLIPVTVALALSVFTEVGFKKAV